MEVHILNGDALTDRMEAAGFENLIVCREALIDGPVDSADFWAMRASYIDKESYYDQVVSEYEKLQRIPENAHIHLWFGDDLFCQANLWFTIDYLSHLERAQHLYRIFPKTTDYRWQEYAHHTPDDFKACYANKAAFNKSDVQLARNLWKAYATGDLEALKNLSATPTHCFRDLFEVVQAHLDRFAANGELNRPERTLKAIMQSGFTDFSKVFPAFCITEGIYGFGDHQVKNMLAKIS